MKAYFEFVRANDQRLNEVVFDMRNRCCKIPRLLHSVTQASVASQVSDCFVCPGSKTTCRRSIKYTEKYGHVFMCNNDVNED